MPRLFIAIDLPEPVKEHLMLLQGGVPGARWTDHDKLHLTVRFLGNLDHGTMRRAIDALQEVAQPAFDIELAGAGFFPPRGQPRSLWIGVDRCPALDSLKHRIDRACDQLGLEGDERKFAPHVTVGRLRDAQLAKVMEFVGRHNLFRSGRFRVDRFKLFSSVLANDGSKYRVEAAFRLEIGDGNSTAASD